MSAFYVTFGQKYRTDPHPVLGEWPGLPDGWIELEATDVIEARKAVVSVLGRAWCDVYSEPPSVERFTLGRLGTLDALVAAAAGGAREACDRHCPGRLPDSPAPSEGVDR